MMRRWHHGHSIGVGVVVGLLLTRAGTLLLVVAGVGTIAALAVVAFAGVLTLTAIRERINR
jgi:hypothetical protein